MNTPTAGHARLVIVGTTGMVGGYALRYALDHPSIGHVTAIRPQEHWNIAPQIGRGSASRLR